MNPSPKCIVDTNVVYNADNRYPANETGISFDGKMRCEKVIMHILKGSGILVIDDRREIISEYCRQHSRNNKYPLLNAFIKFVCSNAFVATKIEQVSVPKTEGVYVNFPDCEELQNFDPADKKFVAVAIAHGESPPIYQATDRKWEQWASALRAVGVRVKFLDPCGNTPSR